MSGIRRGLGRGLSSLISPVSSITTVVEETEIDVESLKKTEMGASAVVSRVSPQPDGVWHVSVASITLNPQQPRKHFRPEELDELVESIRVHGILQPLLVKSLGDNAYQLIAGERRLRAAKQLGIQQVPVVVREGSTLDQDDLELALIENIQRQDLNPIEEASAYQQLMERFLLTQEQLGQRVGKGRSKIANALRLLNLPQEMQDALVQGRISEGHGKILAGIQDASIQMKLFHEILQNKLNVRDVEQQASALRRKQSKANVSSDAWIHEQEELLSQALGTRVVIQQHHDGGQIMIKYYGREDLLGIIRSISG